MQYQIHGKPILFDGECGIYKHELAGISVRYAAMDPTHLASAINGLSKDKAIEAVIALRDLAAAQATLQHTPENLGFPILRQIPEPTPIAEVRKEIANTERFCNDVLRALQGK